MTKKDYKSFEKQKIQQLQQKIDELEEEVKFLNNELLLNKETIKKIGIVSKKNVTTTPFPQFEKPDINRLIKDSDKAMKRFSKKLNESE